MLVHSLKSFLPDTALNIKIYTDTEVFNLNAYTQLMTEIEEHRSLLEDPELADLAREELPQLEAQARQVADGLIDSLLVEADEGSRNAIVEIRAGAGGELSRLPRFDRQLSRQR